MSVYTARAMESAATTTDERVARLERELCVERARADKLETEARDLFQRTMWVLATNVLSRGITDSAIACGAAAALALGAFRVEAGAMELASLLVIMMLGVEIFRPLALGLQVHRQRAAVLAHEALDVLDALERQRRALEPRERRRRGIEGPRRIDAHGEADRVGLGGLPARDPGGEPGHGDDERHDDREGHAAEEACPQPRGPDRRASSARPARRRCAQGGHQHEAHQPQAAIEEHDRGRNGF